MIFSIKLLWPPHRLGRNVRQANEDEVNALSDLCVFSEWLFGALVVLGVFGEFRIAALDPPYHSWLEQWGHAYCDFLVAVGVACEIFASVIAHICQGELTRRSNGKLRLALERTERRSLSADQISTMTALLAQASPASLTMRHMSDDTEAAFFAQMLKIPFLQAGWEVNWFVESYGNEIIPGVRIPDRQLSDSPAVNAARDAFTAASIDFIARRGPDAYSKTGPFGSRQMLAPVAEIYVGHKPPV